MTLMELILRVITLFCFLFVGTFPELLMAADGEARFKQCSSCHGEHAEGRKSLAAPSIAGLPAWYILNQLKKYKDGVRGKHPEDAAGMRMRPMATTVQDEYLQELANYISGLKSVKSPSSFKGNTKKGQQLYGACVSCHGASGEGNQAMKAPPLIGTPDWYLFTQLNNFKKGIRGANPAKDPSGAMMAPMAGMLADDQAIRDVVSYIQTLK